MLRTQTHTKQAAQETSNTGSKARDHERLFGGRRHFSWGHSVLGIISGRNVKGGHQDRDVTQNNDDVIIKSNI